LRTSLHVAVPVLASQLLTQLSARAARVTAAGVRAFLDRRRPASTPEPCA
jgi:hypothetical protein